MGREGTKTILGTSVKGLVLKLLDKYIEEKRDVLQLKQISPSRAKVAELIVLKFLENQDVLEPFLKELGYSDSAIKSIKEYLKAAL